MAIDRDAIVRTIFSNTQTSARSFVSPVLPGYRPTSAACPATSTRLRRRRSTPRTTDRPRSRSRTTRTAATRSWVEPPATSWSRTSPSPCLANPVPQFADLLTQVGAEEAGDRYVPARLGHGLPVHGGLPDAAVPARRLVELLRLQQPAFDQLVQQGSEQPHPGTKAIALYQQAEDILAQDLRSSPCASARTTGCTPRT